MGLSLLLNWRVWVAVVLACSLLATYVQTVRLNATKAQFEAFQTQVKTLGEVQIAENTRKEAEYASKLKVAIDGRTLALNGLRDQSTRSRTIAEAPTAPAGSLQVCFDANTYNAALQRFRSRFDTGLAGTRGLAIEGSTAQIDARTLLSGWPK